ncbi:hypothetical protein DXG01_002268 [Tephrocybe rancida]|nr:hypothetical protein DXG01_002268 [Tephrocybe rancida]
MPPRFVNPHFLPDSSITVSRREIYAETEGTDDEGILKPDPQLVNQLKELIYTVWDPQVDYEPRKSKRRRIQSPPCVQEEVPIAFRLVSSTKPPQPILLRPKTPPPPKTREPEIEDNEEQAALRAERAKAIAVDGSYILAGSHDAMPLLVLYTDG